MHARAKGLYGLPRSGDDWNRRCRAELVKRGYRHVRDIGEGCLFVRDLIGRPPVLILFYVDDFEVSGSILDATAVHAHLMT